VRPEPVGVSTSTHLKSVEEIKAEAARNLAAFGTLVDEAVALGRRLAALAASRTKKRHAT